MVEKIEIIIAKSVTNYLDELIYTLYTKEYFGYIEDAENYVTAIYNFVYNIHSIQHKNTPQKITHFGNFYITYKTTKRTMWYIFFDKKDNRYLIKHITNNHVENATFLHSL